MVLTQPEVAAEFPASQLDDAERGYQDGRAAANDTIDPADGPEDLAAQGRLDGYRHRFTDPTVLFGPEVLSTVDLFDTAESAGAFLRRQMEDSRRLVGSEVEEGLTIKSFKDLDTPDVGEDAIGGFLVGSSEGLKVDAGNTFLKWRRGTAVAGVRLISFDGADHADSVRRLAREMDRRIDRVLAGEISATPFVPTPTPTKAPVEPVVVEGYDLTAMMPTVADFGDTADVRNEGQIAGSGAGGSYERRFKPVEGFIEFQLSRLSEVQSSVELFDTALQARLPIQFLSSLSAQELTELFGPAFGGGAAGSEDGGVEVLELPALGDASTGYRMKIRTEAADFDTHLLFFTLGRISGRFVLTGPAGAVAMEDVLAFANQIVQRVREHSP